MITIFTQTIFLVTALLGFVKGLETRGNCDRQTLDQGLVNMTYDDINLLTLQTTVAADVWFE